MKTLPPAGGLRGSHPPPRTPAPCSSPSTHGVSATWCRTSGAPPRPSPGAPQWAHPPPAGSGAPGTPLGGVSGPSAPAPPLCLALGWDEGGLLQLIRAGEEPLVRCLRDLRGQDGPSFFLPLHEARQVLCHGGLRLSLGLCNRGTSVGGGIHGFDRRGKKDFRLQDKGSSSPLEPKWWPKWILIKSQDKRPPAVNALAQYCAVLCDTASFTSAEIAPRIWLTWALKARDSANCVQLKGPAAVLLVQAMHSFRQMSAKFRPCSIHSNAM